MCSNIAGPDFLDSLARTERGQGNEVNADAFEQRAREWRELDARVDQLQTENTQLDRANTSLRRQIADVRTAAGVKA